jgi:hypothetical protein
VRTPVNNSYDLEFSWQHSAGSVPLRKSLITATLVVWALLVGSCTSHHCSIHRADLVGNYEVKALTWIRRPSHEVGERLTLRADGTWELRMPRQGESTWVKSGHWELTDDGMPEVQLDHAGYPIKCNRHTVKLVIDDDIDARYEKLK